MNQNKESIGGMMNAPTRTQTKNLVVLTSGHLRKVYPTGTGWEYEVHDGRLVVSQGGQTVSVFASNGWLELHLETPNDYVAAGM